MSYTLEKEEYMKYTVQTGKYVFKNFFYIVLFALLPALFLSLSLAEEEIIRVLNAIIVGDFPRGLLPIYFARFPF